MFRQTAVLADLAAARGFIDVKRTALLFDRVVVLRTKEGTFDRETKEHTVLGVERAELDWLTENGILSFQDDYTNELFQTKKPELEGYRHYRVVFLGSLALKPDNEPYVRAAANFVARYSATRMQENIDEDQRAIPLLYDSKFELNRFGATYPYATEAKASYARTTAAVMSEIPVPDELTPWEAILDFRKENEKLAFCSLREWIMEATHEGCSAAELKDKIEFEIARTETALKRARVKHTYRTIETVVTSGVSFVENLLKMKWSKATEAIFNPIEKHFDALEEETEIAENGLYYIVRAKEAFGKQD